MEMYRRANEEGTRGIICPNCITIYRMLIDTYWDSNLRQQKLLSPYRRQGRTTKDLHLRQQKLSSPYRSCNYVVTQTIIYDSRKYQVLIDLKPCQTFNQKIYDSRNYQVLIDDSLTLLLATRIYDSRNYQVLIDARSP